MTSWNGKLWYLKRSGGETTHAIVESTVACLRYTQSIVESIMGKICILCCIHSFQKYVCIYVAFYQTVQKSHSRWYCIVGWFVGTSSSSSSTPIYYSALHIGGTWRLPQPPLHCIALHCVAFHYSFIHPSHRTKGGCRSCVVVVTRGNAGGRRA